MGQYDNPHRNWYVLPVDVPIQSSQNAPWPVDWFMPQRLMAMLARRTQLNGNQFDSQPANSFQQVVLVSKATGAINVSGNVGAGTPPIRRASDMLPQLYNKYLDNANKLLGR